MKQKDIRNLLEHFFSMHVFMQNIVTQVLIAKGLVTKDEILGALDQYIEFFNSIGSPTEAKTLSVFREAVQKDGLKMVEHEQQ